MTRELPADAARAVVAVVQRLAAEADAAAAEIADRIVAEVPEYARHADDDDRAELVVAVRGVVDLFLDVVPAQGRLSESQRSEVARIGERRARQGRSLAAVTAALDVALDIARSRVFAAFWELRPRRSDWAAVEAVVATLDRFGHDVADAFREGHGRVDVEERRDRDRARDAFLGALLADPAPDLRRVRARAAQLDVDLAAPLEVVALLDPAAAGDPGLPEAASGSFDGRASRVARVLPSPSLGPVPIEPGGGLPRVLCVLVPDATARRRREARDVVSAECDRLGLAALYATAATVAQLHPTLVRLLAAAPVLERLTRAVRPGGDARGGLRPSPRRRRHPGRAGARAALGGRSAEGAAQDRRRAHRDPADAGRGAVQHGGGGAPPRGERRGGGEPGRPHRGADRSQRARPSRLAPLRPRPLPARPVRRPAACRRRPVVDRPQRRVDPHDAADSGWRRSPGRGRRERLSVAAVRGPDGFRDLRGPKKTDFGMVAAACPPYRPRRSQTPRVRRGWPTAASSSADGGGVVVREGVGEGRGPGLRWSGASVLERVLLECVRRLGFGSDDPYSRRAVAVAFDQLLELDPVRERFWFLRGMAGTPRGGLAREPGGGRSAGGVDLFDFYVAGLLAGAVERGDADSLTGTVEEHHEAVVRVFVWQVEPEVTAMTLVALAGVAPGEAAALARVAPRDFPGVEEVVAAFRRKAGAARERGAREAAQLLHHAAHELEQGVAPPSPDGEGGG